MAKSRPAEDSDSDEFDEEAARALADPLGKLVKQYRVSLGGVLIVSGMLGAVGVGCLGYALTRNPYSVTFLAIGAALLLLGVVVLVMNIFNVGRSLDVRKRGIRFTEAGVETALLWDEIVDVEVNRTDDTYLGVASVRRRSSDTSSPSGLLTKTEWDVTIRGRDGQTIQLSPIFLRTVPDPKKLIAQIRMRAGL
jgi:hypothetical protein